MKKWEKDLINSLAATARWEGICIGIVLSLIIYAGVMLCS